MDYESVEDSESQNLLKPDVYEEIEHYQVYDYAMKGQYASGAVYEID
jgi:hypothetical protein